MEFYGTVADEAPQKVAQMTYDAAAAYPVLSAPTPVAPKPAAVYYAAPARAPFEIEAGTGEAPEPTDSQGPLVYVKEGYMYVTGKAGEIIVSIKVKVEAEYEKTKEIAMDTYAFVMGSVEKYGSQVQGKALLVKGKVVDGIVYVKTRVIEGRELMLSRATSGYELVKGKTTAGYDLVKTKTIASKEIVLARSSAGYVRISTAVKSIPVPVPVKNGVFYIQTKAGDVAIYLKGNAMYVYKKVGDAVIAIKVKGIATYDAAAAKAKKALDDVASKLEPYTSKASAGYMSVKGKVDGYAIQIKTKGAAGVDKVRSTFEMVKKEVVGKVTLVQGKVNSGFAMVSDKVNDTAVYFKDGYVYIVSKVADKTVYIRAKVTEVGGVVKVKVYEAYVNTESLALAVVQYLNKYLEQAKQKAGDKPVTAAAAGGAIVVGAGGVATGGLAGGLAGATLGMPMALFTFGLSIPICGMIGGGAGACAGAVVGGTAGAVGGGAAGYGYEHRAEIKSGMDSALVKAGDYKEKLRTAAASQLAKVKGKAA